MATRFTYQQSEQIKALALAYEGFCRSLEEFDAALQIDDTMAKKDAEEGIMVYGRRLRDLQIETGVVFFPCPRWTAHSTVGRDVLGGL